MDRVLIVGGGIGGLALAGALGRRGVEVHLVDNQPEWAITRSGIVLQAPAVRALKALGIVDAVTEAGFGMTGFKYHDASGTARRSASARRCRRSTGPRSSSPTGRARATTCSSAPTGSARACASSRSTATPRPTTPASSCGARCSTARPRSTTSTSTTRPARRAACARSPTRRCTCSPCSPFPSSTACRPRRSRAHARAARRLQRAGRRGARPDRRLRAGRPPAVEAILVDPPWHRGRTVLMGDAVHAPPPTLAAGAAIALEESVTRTEGIIDPTPDFDVAAFERRVWGERAKPY